jgi:hypothetical protein
MDLGRIDPQQQSFQEFVAVRPRWQRRRWRWQQMQMSSLRQERVCAVSKTIEELTRIEISEESLQFLKSEQDDKLLFSLGASNCLRGTKFAYETHCTLPS